MLLKYTVMLIFKKRKPPVFKNKEIPKIWSGKHES